jgi:hypothetical protein
MLPGLGLASLLRVGLTFPLAQPLTLLLNS